MGLVTSSLGRFPLFYKSKHALKLNVLKEQNASREKGRKEFYKNKIRNWRIQSWIEFSVSLVILIFGIVYILIKADWNLDTAKGIIIQMKADLWISVIISIVGFVFTQITLPTLMGKYRNHSNIENFKKGLDIPEDLKVLKKSRS